MNQIKAWAKAIKRDVMTLWFVLQHPQTPWHVRDFAAILTAYALSPIDLIPDFIPVLGYLDDLIIVPLGVWLLLRMVPTEVVTESRSNVEKWLCQGNQKPTSLIGLMIVLALWCAGAWTAYKLLG